MKIFLTGLAMVVVALVSACSSTPDQTISDLADRDSAAAAATTAEPLDATTSTVATAAGATTDPLSDAIEAGIVDCFDPLHDSDGSGGFFAFCDRVTEARSAGTIDCLRPSFQPDNEDCRSWRMTRDDVPYYYFGADEAPMTQDDAAPVPPAADAMPSDDPESSYPSDVVILEWNVFGGCDLLDVCGHYRVFGDGRVEASRGRAAASAGDVFATGQVDAGLVAAVVDYADADPVSVVAGLESPGRCESAFDGLDLAMWIGPADLRIDSCEYDMFNADDPLVLASIDLGLAAQAAAPVN